MHLWSNKMQSAAKNSKVNGRIPKLHVCTRLFYSPPKRLMRLKPEDELPTSDGDHIYEWLGHRLLPHQPLHHIYQVHPVAWSELSWRTIRPSAQNDMGIHSSLTLHLCILEVSGACSKLEHRRNENFRYGFLWSSLSTVVSPVVPAVPWLTCKNVLNNAHQRPCVFCWLSRQMNPLPL